MNDISINTIKLKSIILNSGIETTIELSYQLFGCPIHQAPVVLVNHALTGNSNVAGPNGWWHHLIGYHKTIDLNYYTVIAFNIPGNGYVKQHKLISNYKDYTTQDMAKIFWEGLEQLNLRRLYAIIGGSLGGAIGWEMAFLRPHQIQYLIPIACHYKANDWLIGQVLVQDVILNNSKNPVYDARLHAMLLYRHHASLRKKFNTERQADHQYKVESWLKHHGQKLQERFSLTTYKLMNHLLRTIGDNITEEHLIALAKISNLTICQIVIDTDGYFVPEDNYNTHLLIKNHQSRHQFHVVKSPHGHDAFLIEYQALNNCLKHLFITPSELN